MNHGVGNLNKDQIDKLCALPWYKLNVDKAVESRSMNSLLPGLNHSKVNLLSTPQRDTLEVAGVKEVEEMKRQAQRNLIKKNKYKQTKEVITSKDFWIKVASGTGALATVAGIAILVAKGKIKLPKINLDLKSKISNLGDSIKNIFTKQKVNYSKITN